MNDPKCKACQDFEARFRCNAPEECDCPKCQGFCECASTKEMSMTPGEDYKGRPCEHLNFTDRRLTVTARPDVGIVDLDAVTVPKAPDFEVDAICFGLNRQQARDLGNALIRAANKD